MAKVKRASAVTARAARRLASPAAALQHLPLRYCTVRPHTACHDHTADPPVQLDAILALPLFSCLTNDQLANLCLWIERRDYCPQRPIIFAGEAGDGLYVILTGRVRVLMTDQRGRELMLYVLGAGEIFGEVALVDGQPHSATFEAQTACEVLFIPAAAFTECVSRNADALHVILGVMAHHRRLGDQRIRQLAFMDVYARVVATLMEAAPGEHREPYEGPRCQEIAAIVAATREMVNRVIKDITRRGAVKRQGRRLFVINRESLADCARR